MTKKILFTFELEPGMIVAEDIYRSNGVLLFPQNTTLNELMIAKLPLYNIMELPIIDGAMEKPQVETDRLIEQTIKNVEAKKLATQNSYSQKVKSSEEFKVFNKDYDELNEKLSTELDDFVSGKPESDAEKLIADTLNLLKGSTIQIFDMLHNMKYQEDSIYAHSINVALISATIGKWLSLPEADIKNLALAGLLHDIGKTTIAPELLNKPGKLTDEEFEIIKNHTKQSYQMVRNLPLDIKIKEACMLHHERCDGSGYPFGLTGNKISTYAKILAIADVYDAMTSPRAYRPALCPFKAIQLFESDGLYKYDPKFIMTFLENIGSSYLHNNVVLNDGRIGEIVMLNKLALSKPMIQLDGEFLDLSKHPELSIESII